MERDDKRPARSTPATKEAERDPSPSERTPKDLKEAIESEAVQERRGMFGR